MTRAPTFFLFFAALLAVLGGMHYYLWARLVRDTALPGRRLVLVLFALAALAVPVAMLVARRLSFRLTRGSFTVLFTWLGAAFLLFVALLATDLARALGAGFRAWIASGPDLAPPDPARRVFVARSLASGAVLAAGAATGAAVMAATRDPEVIEVPVRLARLPPALSGFTLAQISDLHVGPTIREKHVQRIVEMTNALRPDAVVITGDLVDASVAELRPATQHLARLRARHGVFFVTGNHEYYAGARPWLAELRRYGIRPLENARVAVGDAGPGGASFDLAGVNDWSVARGLAGAWPALDEALEDRDPDRSLVLLAHQPRGVEDAAAAGVELQLSGHTHGGQIVPWNLVVAAVYPFYKGLYRVERNGSTTHVYVSCGTGYWGPPMRLGAPAEVTRLVLTT